ncbi:MAG TPA: hypothetical protein VGW09_11700 [Nitrososphaeraceae archaeon]|nr:hypothetical protein [Nitrososphaeraceae archaeon]
MQSSIAQGLDNVGKQYVRGEGRGFRKRMQIVDTDRVKPSDATTN